MRPVVKIALLIPLAVAFTFLLKWALPNEEENLMTADHFWAYKTHYQKQYDIVFAGDSRVYRGIDPETIEAQLPYTAVNLGYSSLGLNKAYLDFVERKLNQQGPRVIVLAITPFSLTPEALKNEHYQGLQQMKRTEVFKQLYVNNLFSFFKPYQPESLLPMQDSLQEKYYETHFKSGWIKSYRIPHNPESALPSYEKSFTDNPISLPAVKQLMERVNAWEKAGITVVGFRIPSTAKMEALENEMSGYEETTIRQQFEAFGGTWLNFHGVELNSYDGSHLHYEAAQELSAMLSDSLAVILP